MFENLGVAWLKLKSLLGIGKSQARWSFTEGSTLKEKALFPSGKPPNVIVAEYGGVLARSPSVVADITELPYPKDEIKRAILTMLYVTTDSQLREHLKGGFVSLAGFQAGVGRTGPPLVPAKSLDWTKPIDDQVKQTLAALGTLEKWIHIMIAEQESLLDELKRFLAWEQERKKGR